MNPKYVAGPNIDLDREVVRDRKGRRITERRAREIAAETRGNVGGLSVTDRTTQKVPPRSGPQRLKGSGAGPAPCVPLDEQIRH